MSAWTKNPTETGAYWFQIPGCNPDIVWIHDGHVFGVLKTTFDDSVEYGAKMGGLYWGPIAQPPEFQK